MDKTQPEHTELLCILWAVLVYSALICPLSIERSFVFVQLAPQGSVLSQPHSCRFRFRGGIGRSMCALCLLL